MRFRAEAREDAVQIEVLEHELVHVSLQVFGGEVAHGELLPRLHGKEEILGGVVGHDVVEGVPERHRAAVSLAADARGVHHDGDGVLSEDRRQILATSPLLHRHGVLEKALHNRRVAPVVRRGLQALDGEVSGVQVGNLPRWILHRRLQS
eukprot:scaffold7342_cov269-Pinguiococcus_pyrenoidosus.AAC.10